MTCKPTSSGRRARNDADAGKNGTNPKTQMLFVSPLVKKALYYAAEKHDGQYRKGTKTPFIVHPMLVALGVSEYTNDENTIAAAILHDVVEDCGITLSKLSENFTEKISCMVEELSFPKHENKEKNWRKRKEKYIEAIAGGASAEVMLVIAVDKMSNMKMYFESMLNADHKKKSSIDKLFSGKARDYLWYYGEIYKMLKKSKLGKSRVVKDYGDMFLHYRKNFVL